MVTAIRAWFRRMLLRLGIRAVRASGLPPSSRAVLVIFDPGDGTRSRLVHTNVRSAQQVEQGGLPFLSVVDVWGRESLYRMETVVGMRHLGGIPDLPSEGLTGPLILGTAEGA